MTVTGSVSTLPVANTAKGADFLLLTVTPVEPDSTRIITVDNFFEDVSSVANFSNNVSFNANSYFKNGEANNFSVDSFSANSIIVSGNSIQITDSFTPANSAIPGTLAGQIYYDANFIYVVTANGTIKRAALSSF